MSAAAVRRPLAEYPGINSFALDMVRREGAATRFVQPFDYAKVNQLPRGARSAVLAAALERTNAAQGNDVSDVLREWQRGDTVTVVAGQQVGFAGGPAYTLAKLASLIALRDRLKAAGAASTLFFWMATEDHDWDEVAQVTIHDRDTVRTLKAARPVALRLPVGPLEIPESLASDFLSATGIDRPRWLEPRITFGESFARLLAGILQHEKIVLVDALLPELRIEGRALFESIIRLPDECAAVLASRSAEISAAGYRPQVDAAPEGGFTLLYLLRKSGGREPLRRSGGEWLVGGGTIPTAELLAIASDDPQRISTAALTRPLLQDTALGAGVFIGGPAEVAYYAQASALHELLSIPAPAVALRAHVLVATDRVMRTIDEYAIGGSELFDAPDEILARREPQRTAALEAALVRFRETVAREVDTVREIVAPADGSAERGIEKSFGKIDYHLSRIASRGRVAIARRDEQRQRSIRRMSHWLAPAGAPQDRLLGWYPLYLRFGDALLRAMIEEGEPQRDTYSIVAL